MTLVARALAYSDPSDAAGAATASSAGAAKSREKLPVERPFDLHRFRVVFPDRFAALLRAHFRDAVHIAYVLGVTERTARGWLDGINAPNGPTAVLAVATIPGAVAFLMGDDR